MDHRTKKFKEFIENLPRLCSPTICGTLSQPTTRAERAEFEWSLEQKAILSPANITVAGCSDLALDDNSFLKQESENFFSQKIIAPSPIAEQQEMENDYNQMQDDYSNSNIDDDETEDEYHDEDFDCVDEYNHIDDNNHDDIDDDNEDDEDFNEDNADDLFLSPPVRSSQMQTNIFSPIGFDDIMEEDDTIQSTPKISSQGNRRTRTRTRRDSEC